MGKVMKKRIIGLLSGFMVVVSATSFQNPVIANEIYQDIEPNLTHYSSYRHYFVETPSPGGSKYTTTAGSVKALIVRVGYSDYPLDSSNPAYITYNNDFFYSLYEGKAKGFGLPYNGLADYLHNSSYGKLGLSVGRIIDIQLENTFSSYIGEQGFINYFESDEFCKKLYEQVNIADYDSNSDGAIDALYLWNVTDDSLGEVGGYVYGTRDQNTYQMYVSMFMPEDVRNDENFILNVLIHETGHLLINLPDYYMFKKYPKPAARVDIGSIMGWAQYEKGDYDAWSKWKANWLNNENVLYHELQDGETNTVELSPYDSDTDEGKKIAILKVPGEYAIAVDYSGGINNNDFDTDLRKKGFRFYKLSYYFDIEGIYHKNDPKLFKGEGFYFISEEELGTYQLLGEGDDIDDLFEDDEFKTLRIYDIKIGDKPSFSYSFEDEKIYYKRLGYNLDIVDSNGNDLTDRLGEDIEITFEDKTDAGSVSAYVYNGGEHLWIFTHDADINGINTVIHFEAVPEGYEKLSDIRLQAISKEGENILFDVTTDSENVKIADGMFTKDITITLQEKTVNENTEIKEESNPSDEDIKSEESLKDQTEPPTEPTESSSNSETSENASEASDESLGETQKTEVTTEATAQPSIVEQEDILSKADVKQPVTSSPKSSGTVSKVSLITPKSNASQTQGIVAATNKTAPQTSDKSNSPIWLTIAAASAGVLTTAVIAKRKKKI